MLDMARWWHCLTQNLDESQAGVCKVLDGDMLCQFLELTSTQQENVLTEPQGVVSLSVPNQGSSFLERSLPVDRVLRLLERVHNSLA